MKRFLTKLFKYLLLIYVTASLASLVLDYSLTHSRFYKLYLDAKEENLRDAELLIFGGSRAMAGIDAQRLGRETGLKTYNVGIDDTAISSHVLLLKLLWKRGIKPRYIVLEYLNSSPENRSGWSHGDLRLMPLILTDADVRDYVKENRGAVFAYANIALPFFKYSYYNEELFFPALYTLVSRKTAYRSDDYGDYSYPDEMPGDDKERSAGNAPVTTDTLNTFSEDYRDFLQFCLNHEIQLVTLVAPLQGKHLYTADDSILNYTYLDFPDEDYYDAMHINARGKEKLGKLLAGYLKERLVRSTALN